MATATPQVQADMDAALLQVAAAFQAASSKGNIRFKCPEGYFNMLLSDASPLECKPTRDGKNVRIVQKLTFTILDEALKGQPVEYEFSVMPGLSFGGEEWYQTFSLITSQPKRVNSEAEAIAFLKSEAPNTLIAAKGNVVFYVEVKHNKKGYMKFNFQSARPYTP